MTGRRGVALGVLGAAVVAVLASLAVRTQPVDEAWRSLGPGVEHRAVRLPGGAAGEAVRVDLARADIRVHVPPKRATVRAVRESLPGAVTAVNGSFFDESGAPMGLVLVDGEVRNTLRRADWGVFWVSASQAGIVHTRTWRRSPRADARHALQAGPRLVVGGRPVRLKAQVARRTVVCLRAPSEVVLLVTDAVAAQALSEWLARSPAKGGLGCLDALNLDGGPSTQLSLSARGLTVDVAGGWPVPNALVVVPRTGAGSPDDTLERAPADG